jgi:aminoglycoside 6'-N-acetyltransferase
MLDPTRLSFRAVELTDFPLLYSWRIASHVQQWWDPPASYQALVEEMTCKIHGQVPTQPFLILHDQQPVGYIQSFQVSAWPNYQASAQIAEEAVGVDMFIGNQDYLYQGLGAHILRRFVREVVFAEESVVSCIIGPDPTNLIAVRAYEKAGFRYLKTIQIQGTDEMQHLMYMARTDLPLIDF